MAVLPVGFFMPLPLPMMIPFMGIQSAIMAWQFGSNFQAGKRWISAMDNNTFNKLTPQTLMIENTNAIREMIPTMQDSLGMMTPLVKTVIIEFGKMITEAFGVLNPFKDENGFNFWEPEFDIFKLKKNIPFIFDPNKRITPVPIPKTPSNLITLTQQQVLRLTITQLKQAIDNDFHLYDTATQNLLVQELQRRNRIIPPVIPKPIPKPISNVGPLLFTNHNFKLTVGQTLMKRAMNQRLNVKSQLTLAAGQWARHNATCKPKNPKLRVNALGCTLAAEWLVIIKALDDHLNKQF